MAPEKIDMEFLNLTQIQIEKCLLIGLRGFSQPGSGRIPVRSTIATIRFASDLTIYGKVPTQIIDRTVSPKAEIGKASPSAGTCVKFFRTFTGLCSRVIT